MNEDRTWGKFTSNSKAALHFGSAKPCTSRVPETVLGHIAQNLGKLLQIIWKKPELL